MGWVESGKNFRVGWVGLDAKLLSWIGLVSTLVGLPYIHIYIRPVVTDRVAWSVGLSY